VNCRFAKIQKSSVSCALLLCFIVQPVYAVIDREPLLALERDGSGLSLPGLLFTIIIIGILWLAGSVFFKFLGGIERRSDNKKRVKEVLVFLNQNENHSLDLGINELGILANKTNDPMLFLKLALHYGRQVNRWQYLTYEKYSGGSTADKLGRMTDAERVEYDSVSAARKPYSHWVYVAKVSSYNVRDYDTSFLHHLQKVEFLVEQQTWEVAPDTVHIWIILQSLIKHDPQIIEQLNWSEVSDLALPSIPVELIDRHRSFLRKNINEDMNHYVVAAIDKYILNGEVDEIVDNTLNAYRHWMNGSRFNPYGMLIYRIAQSFNTTEHEYRFNEILNPR
jgi:hypothetical protein